MADSLEDFLKEIRLNLASLPLDEQERRLDVVSVQLAEYMAVRMARGVDEEAAAREAIRQFEAHNSSALYSGVMQPRRPTPLLSSATVDFLYCALATKAVAFLFGLLFWLLAQPFLPSIGSWSDTIVPKYGPSVFLAIAAGIVLLFRDGLTGMVSTLTSSQSAAGTGARWLVMRQAFLTVLSLALLITLRSAGTAGITDFTALQQSPVQVLIGLALLLLMPAAPFFAGWLVARDSPAVGVQGVTLAAVTSGFLSLIDFCFWQFQSPGDTPLELRVALLAVLLLGQGLLAGLAVAGARIGSQDAKEQI